MHTPRLQLMDLVYEAAPYTLQFLPGKMVPAGSSAYLQARCSHHCRSQPPGSAMIAEWYPCESVHDPDDCTYTERVAAHRQCVSCALDTAQPTVRMHSNYQCGKPFLSPQVRRRDRAAGALFACTPALHPGRAKRPKRLDERCCLRHPPWLRMTTAAAEYR